jgi:dipeptidase
MTGLLDRYGQGGGCGHERRSFTYHNSFLVADPSGAFVLETAGRQWAVEQVADGARSISNGLTIPEFAAAHAERLRAHFSRCRVRRELTQSAASSATGPGDLFTVLRDHGTGGTAPAYSVLTGAMSGPCMHAGGVAAASQTTGSWVAELTPGGGTHWVTATAAPCTGLFKPVRVGEPLDLGPAPTDRFDPRTLWWRHELLHRRVLADPERLHGRFAAERDAVERGWLAAPPEPADAFARADELLARWTQDVWDGSRVDRRPPLVRRYWRVRDRRAALPDPPVAGRVA